MNGLEKMAEITSVCCVWQVKSIAKSEASEGLWRLVFTTTTGSSSGKLGPFVGEVLQDIEMDKAQCTSRLLVDV